MKMVIKTAFFVSLYSYGIFLLADYVRPGFVSYVFSVHLFLIPILVFGIWLAFLGDEESELSKGAKVFSRIIFSLILFVVIWREGSVFGDLRLVVAAVGFIVPWVVGSLASESALGQDDDI